MDKVSIIIPVFNGEKYLARCIDSLLNQSYENNEYIFVNDGSIDHTLNILKKFQQKDKRIVIINKENTGVSDSRNQGIKKAKGKYICFCDADDMYEKKYIEINNLQQPNMNVVIQEFIEPEISGVWIGQSEDKGVLEWIEGNGEKLVSGKETPTREV